MAIRRMFSSDIVESDDFTGMSPGAQTLYLHMIMKADDDGLVNSTRTVMLVNRIPDDALTELCDRGFVYNFENGVAVVIHWLVHNKLRKDRYNPTRYVELYSRLTLRPDGSYAVSREGEFST